MTRSDYSCDANLPSLVHVCVKTTRGDPVSYRLLSLPPYLLWALSEAVRRVGGRA